MKYSLSPCPRNAAATSSDQPRLWVECAGDDTWPGALLSCGAAQPQARAGFLPGLAVTMPPRSPPACLTNIIILAASRFCAGQPCGSGPLASGQAAGAMCGVHAQVILLGTLTLSQPKVGGPAGGRASLGDLN